MTPLDFSASSQQFTYDFQASSPFGPALVAHDACYAWHAEAVEIAWSLADGSAGEDQPTTCTALVGSEPWVTLFDEDQESGCVIAGESQNLQIWNKGHDPLTVGWVGGDRRVGSDDYFETGPIGLTLSAGRHAFMAAPYPMPIIWVLAADQSPSAGMTLVDGVFGPISPGMTLDEATRVSGLAIRSIRVYCPGRRVGVLSYRGIRTRHCLSSPAPAMQRARSSRSGSPPLISDFPPRPAFLPPLRACPRMWWSNWPTSDTGPPLESVRTCIRIHLRIRSISASLRSTTLPMAPTPTA